MYLIAAQSAFDTSTSWRYTAFATGVKYLRSIAHGFFVAILSVPMIRPCRLASSTREDLSPLATLFSLIVVDQRFSAKTPRLICVDRESKLQKGGNVSFCGESK